jgi:hypothetical protein
MVPRTPSILTLSLGKAACQTVQRLERSPVVIHNSNTFQVLTGGHGETTTTAMTGSFYYTQSSSAAFRFNFTGQSIALYGYLDTNHGNFSCSIDGVSRGIYSGYYPSKAFQQLICFGDNLDDGYHILHVTNLPLSTDDAWFSIDYAEVWGTNP